MPKIETLIFIVAQLFGIAAFTFNFLSTSSTNKRAILTYNALANFSNALCYILLGAFTGVISSMVAVLRNLVFDKYIKRKKKIPFLILVIYLIVALVVNIPFVNNALDIIPIFNIIIYGIALWYGNVLLLKIATSIAGVTGIIYNLIVKAYTSMLHSISDLIGSLIGLVKVIREKHKKRRKRK